MHSLSLDEKTVSLGHRQQQQGYPLSASDYELLEEIGCGVTAKVRSFSWGILDLSIVRTVCTHAKEHLTQVIYSLRSSCYHGHVVML